MTEKKRIFIFGLGESGLGAISLASKLGWDIDIFDDKYISSAVPYPAHIQELIDQGIVRSCRIPPFDAFRQGGVYDEVFISPGIKHIHPLVFRLNKLQISFMNDVEFAFRYMSPSRKVIGITGTNGKTTVTDMVTHVLNQSGKKAVALGNHGKSIARFHEYSEDTILVAELSSFQLMRVSSPALCAAVVLNITQNHLDYHYDMDEYIEAKLGIYRALRQDAPFFIGSQAFWMNRPLLRNIPLSVFGIMGQHPEQLTLDYAVMDNTLMHGEEILCRIDATKCACAHDRTNALAAYLLAKQFGITPGQFEAALSSFQKPPHRLQLIRRHNGITYIDDSKSTSVDATLAAVNALEGPISLLAGGEAKGMFYDDWATKFEGKVTKIYCYGRNRKEVERYVADQVPIELFVTLEEAFEKAQAEAVLGTTILLSPGASSIDQFTSYEHRGQRFQECVSSIK